MAPRELKSQRGQSTTLSRRSVKERTENHEDYGHGMLEAVFQRESLDGHMYRVHEGNRNKTDTRVISEIRNE
jgi:hypothetical protein